MADPRLRLLSLTDRKKCYFHVKKLQALGLGSFKMDDLEAALEEDTDIDATEFEEGFRCYSPKETPASSMSAVKTTEAAKVGFPEHPAVLAIGQTGLGEQVELEEELSTEPGVLARRTAAELRSQLEQSSQDRSLMLVKIRTLQCKSAALSTLHRQALTQDTTLMYTILKAWRHQFIEASEHRIDNERNILQTRRYAAVTAKRVLTRYFFLWSRRSQARRFRDRLVRGIEALCPEQDLSKIVLILWHGAACKLAVQQQQGKLQFNRAARHTHHLHLAMCLLGWSLVIRQDALRDQEWRQEELEMRNMLKAKHHEERRLVAELEEMGRQRLKLEDEISMYKERDMFFRDVVEMSRQATARLAKNEERFKQLYSEIDNARRLRDRLLDERDELMRKLHAAEIESDRLRAQDGRQHKNTGAFRLECLLPAPVLHDAQLQAKYLQVKLTDSQRQQLTLDEQLEEMGRRRLKFDGEIAVYQQRDSFSKDVVEMSRQATARLAKNDERFEQLYSDLDNARTLRDKFQEERDDLIRKLNDVEIELGRLRAQDGRHHEKTGAFHLECLLRRHRPEQAD